MGSRRLSAKVLSLLAMAPLASADSSSLAARFVQDCATSTGLRLPAEGHRVRHLGDTQEMSARLLTLIRSGEKSITFSTERLYRGNRDLTPVRGSYTVITDLAGQPGALVRTTWVKIKPFSKVSERESRFEGKPVRPIEAWRRVHWDFFTRTLAPYGQKPGDDLPVTIEKFKLVCPGSGQQDSRVNPGPSLRSADWAAAR